MKRLLILIFLLPMDLFAQGEHLIALPISKEILKKNKVTTVNVLENVDSLMVQTNTYFINSEGKAFEHIYLDPANEGGGPFDIERLRWSKDTMGFVQYTQGMYAETGELNSLISDQQYYYTPTGKLLKMIFRDLVDYRISIYDTLHPNFKNKWEYKIVSSDTVYMRREFQDDKVGEHILRDKVNGKWVEIEKSFSTFKNEELETYKLYKFGKLVQEYNSKDDLKKRTNDEKEEDFGLPAPQPFTKVLYSDKMDLIYESKAIEKTAKFRLELHYENGISSDLSHYEVYDNKNGLLLIKSNPTGEYKTEFHYLFGK
jgi:hypothetical protein